MQSISKTEFIDLLSKDNKILKIEADRNLKQVLSAIEKVLSKGNKLTIPGFGVFYISKQKAREGKNPRTGEAMKIKASNSPRFRAGSKLKAACN